MKIMLIGPSAAGKTTLIQRLIDEEIKYDKTQAVEYIGNFIDTPGVGVITKIDKDDSNPKQARSYLELAGCTTIFEVSSYTGEGVEALSQGFHDMVNKYREENKGRYADDYFD